MTRVTDQEGKEKGIGKQNIVYILFWKIIFDVKLPGKGKVWHCSWRGWPHSHPCTAWGRAPSTRRPEWGTCRCGRYHAVSLKWRTSLAGARVTKHREQVWCRYYHLKVGRDAGPTQRTTITTTSRLSGPFWLMKNSNCNWAGVSVQGHKALCYTLHNLIVGILNIAGTHQQQITSVRDISQSVLLAGCG